MKGLFSNFVKYAEPQSRSKAASYIYSRAIRLFLPLKIQVNSVYNVYFLLGPLITGLRRVKVDCLD